MRIGLARMIGTNMRERLGTLLALAGLLTLLYSVGAYFELTPGSQVVLPDPPALLRATPGSQPTAAARAVELVGAVAEAPSPGPPATPASQSSASLAVPRPSLALPAAGPNGVSRSTSAAVLSGAIDRLRRQQDAQMAVPGLPIALRIEKIGLETKVVETGISRDKVGNPVWETVPFVAAYYTATGLVGASGNAVIAGHVVTLREGNVFRNLYQVDFGDKIEVVTKESTFVYQVEDIKLVPPDAVEVMAPTPDATLTLITCGGRFDTRTRTFDKRLVVVGKLVQS